MAEERILISRIRNIKFIGTTASCRAGEVRSSRCISVSGSIVSSQHHFNTIGTTSVNTERIQGRTIINRVLKVFRIQPIVEVQVGLIIRRIASQIEKPRFNCASGPAWTCIRIEQLWYSEDIICFVRLCSNSFIRVGICKPNRAIIARLQIARIIEGPLATMASSCCSPRALTSAKMEQIGIERRKIDSTRSDQ